MQAWPNIVRHRAQIFPDDSGFARLVEHRSQAFFALAAIRVAVFPGGISARIELRDRSASSLAHFIPGEWKEFGISVGPPGKRIEPVEAEHMIAPKDVENLSNPANPLPPPGQIPLPHHVPPIERDPPVLSTFLRELVVLEIWLGRRASRPFQREFVPPGINIRTIETDPEWNVTHQGDLAFFRVGPHCGPLVKCDPLDVFEKRFAFGKASPHFGCLLRQPPPRRIRAAMFLPPSVPSLAVSILFHERAEECVIC